MPAESGPPGAWAAEQLTAFVAALERVEADGVLREGIERAAEALEAEVAAVIVDGTVQAAVGFPRGQAPARLLDDLASGNATQAELPGLGRCEVLSVPFDEGTDGRLLAARADEGGWSLEERNLLRGMSRVLALSHQAKRTVAALRERQALLERLTRIQRSITSRAPLPDVLDAIVSGARELLGDNIVALRRVLPDDPTLAEVLCASGVEPGSPMSNHIKVGTGAGGRAIAENRLVVIHDYQASPDALANSAGTDLHAAMAAPVREDGVTVGSLVVASVDPGRRYSPAEQEVLKAFADHASLAVTDARTVQSLRQALEDARHDAMHDVLTNLPNRALLSDRLAHAIARKGRRGGGIALVYLDLDGFKHVNDSLGHDMGDELLVALSRRFATAVRDSDTVARLGGDEFAVLIEDVSGGADAIEVADRLLDALVPPVELGGREVVLSASIGVALGDAGTADSQALLRNADLAMYEAKRAGGGRQVLFKPDMHLHTLDRIDIEQALRRAIASDQLVLDYQPIRELDSGRVVEVEALVRWQHPTRGLMQPAEFIPIAESGRLITVLGEWVLRTACAQAAGWPADIRLAVNVSPRQVDHELEPLVRSVLADTGLGAHRLTLEVTEGVAMADSAETLGVITALHDTGIRIAIDDFGTGYSSLGRLRSLPVDIVKIDRSFVAHLTEPHGAALISAIVALCQGCGLTSVAEGVETPEQLRRLRVHGCDLGQGFLLGAPARATQLEQMFDTPLLATFGGAPPAPAC